MDQSLPGALAACRTHLEQPADLRFTVNIGCAVRGDFLTEVRRYCFLNGVALEVFDFGGFFVKSTGFHLKASRAEQLVDLLEWINREF